MYKTIIMPVDVFEMELSDKAIRHAEFLAQDDGVIHLLHVLPGSASLSLHRFAAGVSLRQHLRLQDAVILPGVKVKFSRYHCNRLYSRK